MPKQTIPPDRRAILERYRGELRPRTRTDEESFLRQYIDGVDRPCVYNKECRGMKSPLWKPVVLAEKLSRAAMMTRMETGQFPEIIGPCVMCGRFWPMNDWLCSRSERTNIKTLWCQQNYYNIVGAPGEYALEQCFMSSKENYQGIILPIVAHVELWYKQVVKKDPKTGQDLYYFEQPGYYMPRGKLVNPEEDLDQVFR